MARVSLNRRIGRIWDAVCVPGSWEWRERQLSDAQRAALLTHRQAVADKISTAENEHGAEWFALLLDGTLHLPPMPANLRKALGLTDPLTITETMTASDVERAWSNYRDGDEQ